MLIEFLSRSFPQCYSDPLVEASTASTAELIAVPAGLKDFHQCRYIFPMAEHIAVEMAKSHEQSSLVDLTPTRPHLPLMFMEQSQQNRIRRLQQAKAPYISRSPSATELRFPSHPLRQKLLLGSCDLLRRGGRRNVCWRIFPHLRTSSHLPD